MIIFPFLSLRGKGFFWEYFMKIKMLKTRQGSPDGVVVNTYISGETVNMPDELAHVFIRHRDGDSPQAVVDALSRAKVLTAHSGCVGRRLHL